MFTYDFDEKGQLEDFGLGALSLDEAAELIAKCLFCSGEIQVQGSEEINSIFNPSLDKLLKEHIYTFRTRLTSAIDDGTLKTLKVQRDIDELIIPEQTYVKDEVLYEWLSERSIDLGEWYSDEYIDFQGSVVEQISNTIEAEYIKKNHPHIEKASEGANKNEVLTKYFELKILEEKLNRNTDSKDEKPLSTKERQTALKLIVGMAIKGYRYDPKRSRNNAIGDIAEDLESLGISLDQDTIRKWLKEASENLPEKDPET